MKYNTEFLMECLLLRIRSKQAYLKILERKLFPLPHPTTIRTLLSCMPCSFGQNEFALQSIKRNLKGKPKAMRYGSLVWDEMVIKEDVIFNSQKLQFDGHVDYGNEITISKHDGQLADHTLLFVFLPYLSNWIQPFVVYATKRAASGDSLHSLLCKAIVALRSHGAIVKSVVCDGAQSNKRVMHLFGASGNSEESEHKFSLPGENKNLNGCLADPLAETCPDSALNETLLQDETEPSLSHSSDNELGDFDEIDNTGLDDWPEINDSPEYGKDRSSDNMNDINDSSFEHF